jgi:hypothetical protein
VHPTNETPISPPDFWWRAASAQQDDTQQGRRERKQRSTTDDFNARERVEKIAMTVKKVCANFRPFTWPEPDEPRFREAVMPKDDTVDDYHDDRTSAAPSASCIGVSRSGSDALARNLGTGHRGRRKFRFHSETVKLNYDPPKTRTARDPPRADDPSNPAFDIGEDDLVQPNWVLAVARKAYAVALELLDTIHGTNGECCGGATNDDLTAIIKAIDAADELAAAYDSAYGGSQGSSIGDLVYGEGNGSSSTANDADDDIADGTDKGGQMFICPTLTKEYNDFFSESSADELAQPDIVDCPVDYRCWTGMKTWPRLLVEEIQLNALL